MKKIIFALSALFTFNAFALVDVFCWPTRRETPVAPFTIQNIDEHARGGASIMWEGTWQEGISRRNGTDIVLTFRNHEDGKTFSVIFPRELQMLVENRLSMIPGVVHWRDAESMPVLHRVRCQVRK